METVLINASIDVKKKSEFFQVMESLKSLIKIYCTEFDTKINDDNSLVIRIIFDKKKDLEKNFNNKEFSILKGSVRSLCKNVSIDINGIKVK